jgi:ATP-dependent DNA helicase RecQ
MGSTVDRYSEILKEYWGYTDFRGIQRDIIESIGNGRDTLGLMPTGGGKSITFQVPALAQEGVCIVITPLIALMKDQVANLKKRGIKAAAIYSGLTRNEIIVTLENCIFGGVKLLYVSPERLSTEIFLLKLRHIKVSFITVDEAHCISQWGYDFRPSYLTIIDIRKVLPGIPVLALTATATPQVVKDIQDKLGFHEENAFKMSFERKNLAYVVRRTEDKNSELIHILKNVGGSAIIYTRSRKKTKEIAEYINKEGIKALHYHAGLENADKDKHQKLWSNNAVRVMVATNAFGMGIDKPDVKLVIHVDLPDSPEAYFQEAGRAGRDGLKAYAVLLYNDNDKRKLLKRVADTFPEKDYIKIVYEHLAYYYQVAMGSGNGCTHEFNIDAFCHSYKHFPIQVNSALKILSRSSYIEYNEENDNATRIMFLVTKNDLYRLDELSEAENKVVESLLRDYGGLFADYVYIDESLIALQTGYTVQQVYLILKGLNQQRILHFIPRSKTPLITYTQRREDMNNIIIPKPVYEDRKAQYEKRIKSIIEYASSDTICRSRMLLRYFGEKNDHNCGQCDVCIAKKKSKEEKNEVEYVRTAIMTILNDGGYHAITELKSINFIESVINSEIEYLISEEIIIVEDGLLTLNKNISGH